MHDILTITRYFQTLDKSQAKSISLVAKGNAAPLAAAAVLAAEGVFQDPQVEKTDFRFASIRTIDDANFLPGALRFGDLPTLRQLAGLD